MAATESPRGYYTLTTNTHDFVATSFFTFLERTGRAGGKFGQLSGHTAVELCHRDPSFCRTGRLSPNSFGGLTLYIHTAYSRLVTRFCHLLASI